MNWSLNRARLGAITISLGLFCILMGSPLSSHSASAPESRAAGVEPGKRFATVLRVRGEVVASGGGSGRARQLREGDAVYVGERVRAPALAEAVLKTEDAGFIAIRPSTEFVAERFAAEDKPSDNLAVRLLTGSLRVISGWIGRTNRAGHQVVTPTATIGIRGTDHEPYVLSAELAAATANREGTYDKVNRGGTTMQVGENKLDIDAGRVGFVRAAAAAKESRPGFRERALMTILLPVLLDKVPNFYVPGEFDAELDRYSQTADEDSQRQLEQRRKSPPPPVRGSAPTKAPAAVSPAPTSVPAAPAAPAAKTTAIATAAPTPAPAAAIAGCEPTAIAKSWLEQLDAAIVRRDAAGIVALFAPEAAVRATVRGNEGRMTSVDLSRDELAASTLAAMAGLTDYKQRRVWIEGKPAGATCDRIGVRSVAIEQGRQSGKPYRFEALEEYVIELRAGKWLAIKAETTQQ